MPERREGLDTPRAAELEEILERQFEIAGLGKSEFSGGLSAVEIIDRDIAEMSRLNISSTLADVLDSYFQSRVVDIQLSVQMALICGELFGAGDLSQIKTRLARSEARAAGRSAVVRAGTHAQPAEVLPE